MFIDKKHNSGSFLIFTVPLRDSGTVVQNGTVLQFDTFVASFLCFLHCFDRPMYCHMANTQH